MADEWIAAGFDLDRVPQVLSSLPLANLCTLHVLVGGGGAGTNSAAVTAVTAPLLPSPHGCCGRVLCKLLVCWMLGNCFFHHAAYAAAN